MREEKYKKHFAEHESENVGKCIKESERIVALFWLMLLIINVWKEKKRQQKGARGCKNLIQRKL